MFLVVVLAFAACGGGDDDDDASTPDSNDASTDQTAAAPSGDLTALEVDRSSRFAGLDSFCEPATEEPTEAPEATDDGITEDSISVTQIRVTLEDLEGIGFAIPIGDPADQAEKFVGLINDRCGGINGRKIDLSIVEAPPLAVVDNRYALVDRPSRRRSVQRVAGAAALALPPLCGLRLRMVCI